MLAGIIHNLTYTSVIDTIKEKEKIQQTVALYSLMKFGDTTLIQTGFLTTVVQYIWLME